METYKIGNKVDCIIRSTASGLLGQTQMEYANQPYTIIKNVEASMRFVEQNRKALVGKDLQLNYNVDTMDILQLNNVPLTKKILELMYDYSPDKMCHHMKNMYPSNGELLFTSEVAEHGIIYQVFIYNENKDLIKAIGSIDQSNLRVPLDTTDESVLVFYSYDGEMGYSLNRSTNTYVALDLIIEGNENDIPQTYYIHLHKCSLTMDKNMYFKNGINTINLMFKIIPCKEDYITIK
jgi:hypothetical protein